MKQATFESLAWKHKGKMTRRERFLAEMDAVIPWMGLIGLIEPHYPKAGNGTQPMPLERMLRIHFMQHWFNLSDPAMEDALYDSESMRRFAGIELAEDAVPDESTILRFRNLLEQHKLSEGIFAQIRKLLEEKRRLLKSGTIVDATIIAAPPSTKNAEGARDPEMHQTKKGKDWHFGMKARALWDREHPITLEHRVQVRAELSTAVLERFHLWLEALEPKVLPQSLLGKPVRYALGQWPKLTAALRHGEVPLDNNRCENAIRPFVVGRKGWLFSDTVKGAVASANLCSLVESAKANGAEPHAYLSLLFERLPAARNVEDSKHYCHGTARPDAWSLPTYAQRAANQFNSDVTAADGATRRGNTPIITRFPSAAQNSEQGTQSPPRPSYLPPKTLRNVNDGLHHGSISQSRAYGRYEYTPS